MAQKHLQLLRNTSAYTSYAVALAALKGWDFENKPLADGTPVVARYTDDENNQKTLLGVVNNGTMDIVNNVSEYRLRGYEAWTGETTALSSGDTVNEAFAKLEKHIADVAADVTVSVVRDETSENTTDHLTVTSNPTSTGDTFTLTLNDVASASGLSQEITDRQSGDTALSNRLGDGVTSANTATAQLTALSGNNSSTSAETSVEGAKRYADAILENGLDELDAESVSGESKVVIDVTQEDGQITATAANLTGVKLAGYAEGSDADIAATDTLGEALGKLQAQINAMDKSATTVDGQVVVTVTEEDGKVSETKANVKDLQLGGYSKTSDTGAISGTDTVNVALSKIENNLAAVGAANTLEAADKSVNVVTANTGTTVALNIRSGEHVILLDSDATSGGVYTDLDLVKITGDTLPTNVKERYQLLASDDTQIGQNIDIYKDNTLKSVELDDQNLVFTYIVDSGESVVNVDVSKFLAETEFGSGVTANTDGYVHGVVDPTSESFLTVGEDGFKLAGVQDAIDDAIEALDVSGDTAVDGQYVAAIEETDGIVAVKTRANVSEAVLNNYTKGSDASAVASTDTVNQAISKLENQVDKAKAAATTVVEEGTDNPHLSITSSTDSNTSATTYTVTLTDVASDSALTNEISHRKAVDGINGDAYTANTGTRYISGAISLNDADVKLDSALSALSDSLDSTIENLDADVSGNSTHVTVGVVEKNGVITAVTVAESDIASESDLVDLSGKTVTLIESTNSSISAVSTAATDGTVKYDLTTDGSKILLTGYDATGVTGDPAASDSVNAAIAKLYNKIDAGEVEAGSAITVTATSTGQMVDVKLDTESTINEYDATHAQAVDSTSKNVLEITEHGLYLNNNWDCGTY